jgi:hypothetical protein
MYQYTPPSGGLDVDNPRSLSDFPGELAASYFFALTAYAQYLSLTSGSQRYHLEGIQVIVFLFFPFLPIIQLFTSILKLVSCLVRRRAEIWNVRYLIAGLFGMRANCETGQKDSFCLLDIESKSLKTETQDYTNFRYLGRLLLLLGYGVISGLSVAAYVRRLGITFMRAKYVGALGLDHRMGWMAIGGLTATILSLPIHAINTHWRVSPRPPRHSASREVRDPTTDTIYVGTDGSQAQDAAPTSNRAVELSIETVIAALVQDQLQGITNHPSTYRIFRSHLFSRFKQILFWIIVIPPLVMKYRKAIPRLMLPLLGLFWLLSVAGLQLSYDIEEVKDISAGVYKPWNYRWAVNDLPWWSI